MQNVRSRLHGVGPVQISAQGPVQIRPLVHQPVGHAVAVRLVLLIWLLDLKHALRNVVFRPVREQQALRQADLHPEPDLVHGEIIVSVQIGKRYAGRPPNAVLQIAGDLPALQEGPGTAVIRVVVHHEGHRSVPVQKLQPCQLHKVRFQCCQIVKESFSRHQSSPLSSMLAVTSPVLWSIAISAGVKEPLAS